MAQVIHISGEENYVNDGERRVVEAFAERLPEDVVVFPNVEVVSRIMGTPRSTIDEIDAIVITPDVVVCVEIKDLVGNVTVTLDEMIVDGDHRPNPAVQTRAKARRVKSRMKSKDPALGQAWVDSLVVLARKPAHLSVDPGMKGMVVDIDRAVEVLTPPWHHDKSVGSLAGRADAIRSALGMKPLAPRSVFGSYKVEKLLTSGENETTFEARHTVTGVRCHLRLIGCPPGESPTQRRKRLDLIARSWKIAGRVDDAACLVPPGEIDQFDDGTIAIAVPMGDDMSLVDRCSGEFDEVARRRVVADVATALATLHRSGITHGRLSPEAVDVRAKGRALLGLLDGAVMPESTGGTQVHTDLVPAFSAPEAIDRSRLGPAADLYSLGRLINWLWPTEHNADGPEPIGPAPTPLPELAESLTAFAPAERGPTAAEVALRLSTTTPDPSGQVETSEETVRPAPGAVVQSFELIEELTRSDGDLWRAVDVLTGVDCVVKFFDGETGVESATNQYSLLSSQTLPGIQPVRHLGATSSGAILVTEFLDGADLRSLVDDGRTFSLDEALTLVSGLLDTLGHLHLQEAVHGDVKPANLVLTEGRLVLVDFDLAVPPHSEGVAGSAKYLPPDVEHGRNDPGRDLFGAGVVLHELLVGKRPEFVDHSPRISEEIVAPVAEVLSTALARSNAERFGSAAEFAEALRYAGRASRGFTVGELVVEGLPTYTGPEPVARMGSGEPIENPNIHPFSVAAPTGERLTLHVVEDPDGGGQVLVHATDGCGPGLERLTHGLRLGYYDMEHQPDLANAMIGIAAPSQRGRTTIRKTEWSELNEACGFDVQATLHGNGVTRIATRGEIFGDTSPRKNFLCALFPTESLEAAVVIYLVSRVLPIHRGWAEP